MSTKNSTPSKVVLQRQSRRKEILKIRAEINEMENRKTTEKINQTKSWSFEKIKKTDKLLARLTKEKREGTQINKIINEK